MKKEDGVRIITKRKTQDSKRKIFTSTRKNLKIRFVLLNVNCGERVNVAQV